MKKIFYLLIFGLLLFTSCDESIILAYKEYHFDSYDGNLTNTLLESNNAWSTRQDFASVVFNNEIYIFGGYDITVRGENDCYREDVYKSVDGINWTLLNEEAPFNGRRGLGAAVLNDYIYVAGGFSVEEETGLRGYKNDVWRSSDGITWELVIENAPWDPRMNFSMISTDTNIYIFGGFRQVDDIGPTYFDDMWKFDGTTWTQISTATLPGGRSSMACTLVGDDIYIQGGSFYGATQSSTGRVDTSVDNWASLFKFETTNEAAGWTCLNSAPIESCNRRSQHSLVYLNNKLWLLSGRSNSSYHFTRNKDSYGTLYYDIDTNTWTMDSYGAPCEPIFGYCTANLNDKVYIMGGFSSSGPRNSVWTIEEGDN